MFAVMIVLLGHHVLQVQAMHDTPHTSSHEACDDSCEHEDTSMDICEQIQNDEMQIQLDFSILPAVDTYFCVDIATHTYAKAHSPFVSSSPPIDHQQLARSHLSS